MRADRKRNKQVADLIASGLDPKDALAQCGFKDSISKQGATYIRRVQSLYQAVNDALTVQRMKGGITPEQMRFIAETTLAVNAMKGEKKGCGEGSSYAAVQLGKHKDVRIFEPDNSVSLNMLVVPPGWEQKYAIDAQAQPLLQSGDLEVSALPES